ncbi:hypothetical protein IB232_12900 [Pseudomonas sp. PDM15]|uniref:hypothetical protein n=1 Tax=Pseudomonas sp. PDM15 TaxID=2769303 RepID=UPI001785427B|nr:hypothetical protein [Pseudomonas sp. PDM15]MBD9426226.1 hypothetical protein [Pseudomonas sp. PDM15]
MKASNSIFTLNTLGLALLLATGQALAVDDNPAAKASIKAMPDASQSHTLKVQLDQKGEWTVIPSTTVKMRFQYTHQWSQQPNKPWARIYVGEAKIPKGGENYFEKSQMFDLGASKVLASSGYLNANLPFKLLVADGIPGADIALYCGFEKSNRLKQGKGLNQVLRQGFNVKLNVPLKMAGFYQLGGGPGTSRPASSHQYHLWDKTAPVTIQCLGNPAIADKMAPPKGPQGLAAGFQVNSVELVAQPAKLKGVCPAEITLKATIKGSGGGQIKYWLEEVGGKGAAVQMTSNLPGKVGEATQRVISQKVSIKPDPQPQQQGIGGFKANTQGQGTLVKRSYRLNVIAPNKKQSSVVAVEVLCTSTLNIDIGEQGKQLQMDTVKPEPHPQPNPGMKLQAPQPQPKPEMKLQAPQTQPEPPKPSLQIKAVEPKPQPPKPQMQLQAQ